MRYLKTTEAANLLDVAPKTLRVWERKFGFPRPQRSPGGHRSYAHGEVAALRDSLRAGLSISAAVVRARAGVAAEPASLVRALLTYDESAADRAVETALALRSVERSVEEILLPSLEALLARQGPDSAVWAFAARWATDWLGRARRLATPPQRRLSMMLGYALRDELDLDAPYVRALELFCLRAGFNVLSIPAHTTKGLSDAAAVQRPDIVVLAGGQLPNDVAARWSYLISRSAGPTPVVFYRPAPSRGPGPVLPRSPGKAQTRLVDLTDAGVTRDSVRALGDQRRAVAGA